MEFPAYWGVQGLEVFPHVCYNVRKTRIFLTSKKFHGNFFQEVHADILMPSIWVAKFSSFKNLCMSGPIKTLFLSRSLPKVPENLLVRYFNLLMVLFYTKFRQSKMVWPNILSSIISCHTFQNGIFHWKLCKKATGLKFIATILDCPNFFKFLCQTFRRLKYHHLSAKPYQTALSYQVWYEVAIKCFFGVHKSFDMNILLSDLQHPSWAHLLTPVLIFGMTVLLTKEKGVFGAFETEIIFSSIITPAYSNCLVVIQSDRNFWLALKLYMADFFLVFFTNWAFKNT